MKKHYLTSIFTLLDELNVWDERVEQVQMEIDHNPEIYPLCHRRFREYRDTRRTFENSHPTAATSLTLYLFMAAIWLTLPLRSTNRALLI